MMNMQLFHENSLGKTECWYVLGCKEDTKMVMGHHAKTKEELVKLLKMMIMIIY